MANLLQTLKNKITGTTVVDNKANPGSAYNILKRKLDSQKPMKGNVYSRPEGRRHLQPKTK